MNHDWVLASKFEFIQNCQLHGRVHLLFHCTEEPESNSFFSTLQSKALQKLSLVPQQVVATGGGAVVRPLNWYCSFMNVKAFQCVIHINSVLCCC